MSAAVIRANGSIFDEYKRRQPSTDPQPQQPVPDQYGAYEVNDSNLTLLLNCSQCIVHDAVIFVGGAGDDSIGHVMRQVLQFYSINYRNRHSYPHDVWYSTYDGDKKIAKIVLTYKKKGRKVAVVGHSWGGAESAILLTKNQTLNVDIFITLDPVNKKPKPARTKNILVWHNVYVDYTKANDSMPNRIARAGTPWQEVKQASSNDTSWTNRRKVQDHADAWEMFTSPQSMQKFCTAMEVMYYP